MTGRAPPGRVRSASGAGPRRCPRRGPAPPPRGRRRPWCRRAAPRRTRPPRVAQPCDHHLGVRVAVEGDHLAAGIVDRLLDPGDPPSGRALTVEVDDHPVEAGVLAVRTATGRRGPPEPGKSSDCWSAAEKVSSSAVPSSGLRCRRAWEWRWEWCAGGRGRAGGRAGRGVLDGAPPVPDVVPGVASPRRHRAAERG
jgi:hypothetical protein